MTTTNRPRYCCGVCPKMADCRLDCTCRGNPRCPKNRAKRASMTMIASYTLAIALAIAAAIGGKQAPIWLFPAGVAAMMATYTGTDAYNTLRKAKQ